MRGTAPLLPLLLALLAGPSGSFAGPTSQQPADGTTAPSGILGPFTGEVVRPYVWNGDLRDLPQSEPDRAIKSPGDFRLTPAERRALEARARQREAATAPLAPTAISAPMPPPAANFAGMSFAANGSGWPPDTNGDVGPNHYMQTVNTSVAIYDKATGAALSTVTFDSFFAGPPGSPCDTSNDGDPVVLYDPAADRWIVTDFAWFNFNTGPYFECIAVSQTGDPVSGGWYFYALQTNTGTFAGDFFNDYPKLGVWPDGYYMSANMFEAVGTGFGVRLWALDRAAMLTGGALTEVHFDLCLDGACGSFLPSNLRGTAPPAGAPNYFMQVAAPSALDLYRFHVDWAVPANSTLTGPIPIPVAPFAITNYGVPQPGTGQTLDTLSFRLMMQLQYRNYGAHESLYAVHTIDDAGIASSRWYEVRNPGGAPALQQQGTHKLADGNHRWMGSIAADQDGNLALGYSVSGTAQFPSIRYAGQRYGEFPGTLPQTEASLIAGTGSQTGISRWGDYSAMSIDPTDDCTFWYTQEYYAANGSNWQTRIGSFKFPACGQALGTLTGRVYDAVTNADIPGAPVTANGPETLTAQTDGSGNYSLQLLPGTYDVTGGPLLPGYPNPATISSVVVIANVTTTQDIALTGVPNLIYDAVSVVDTDPGGNGNGYAEPGESAVQLFVSLENNGAAPGTGIDAVLSTTTPGVTVTQDTSAYPDLAATASAPNTTAYRITLAPTLACGTILQFQLAVTTDQGPYGFSFPLPTGIAQPPVNSFFDDFESGVNGWTTGGINNLWAQTTSQSNSPTHSWTDSPAGNYPNGMDSWLQSPVIDLTGRSGVTVSGYVLYALEPGFDYAYLEYSVDGGTSWNPTPLAEWNGTQASWIPSTAPAPALDNQSNARLRYRVLSDGGVVDDGFYVDDFGVSYTEILCQPPISTADLSITKSDGLAVGSVGQASTYAIVVANSGPGNAPGALVVDTFPAGFAGATWTCIGAASGTCPASGSGNLSQAVGLPAGSSVAFTVNGTLAGPPGALVNTATVAAPAGVVDSNLGNNSAADTTDVISPASVSAIKTAAGDFSPGGLVTYTVVLTNAGPATQFDNPGDEFSDTLPALLTLNSVSATSGIATMVGNTASWNGAIAAGGSVTITIQATIAASVQVGDTISNQGNVDYDANGDGTNEISASTDDPGLPGAEDPTAFVVTGGPISEIPTLGPAGFTLLAAVLAVCAFLLMRRRRA